MFLTRCFLQDVFYEVFFSRCFLRGVFYEVFFTRCATAVDEDGIVVDHAWGDCLDGCPGTSESNTSMVMVRHTGIFSHHTYKHTNKQIMTGEVMAAGTVESGLSFSMLKHSFC